MAAARQAGEEVFHHPLQHLLVAKEESESQPQNLPECWRRRSPECLPLARSDRFHAHDDVLAAAISIVFSVSRISSRRSLSL